jgi:hypothetical protein
LPFDFAVEVLAHGSGALEDGILQSISSGISVNFDHAAVKSQDGRTAVGLRIHARLDAAQAASGEESAQFAEGTGIFDELGSNQIPHCFAETLRGLQNQIAHEAIANCDIDSIGKQVESLTITGAI